MSPAGSPVIADAAGGWPMTLLGPALAKTQPESSAASPSADTSDPPASCGRCRLTLRRAPLKRLAITLLAMMSPAGCQDRRTPVGPPRVGISAALSDGVSGGNPHFFFLPPIVTQPTFSGTFDPALRPSVEICHLTIDPSCANPVLRFDPSQVTLDLTNQQYKVNWNSDPTLIVSSDTYRIRVLVGRILLGFRDVVPVSTPQQVPKDQSPD